MPENGAGATSTTQLIELTLRNFRSFKEFRVALHPKLTVLVARNGMGKTAVLDALALALAPFVAAMRGGPNALRLAATDVRSAETPEGQQVDQLPVELVVHCQIAAVFHVWAWTWSDARKTPSRRGEWKEEAKRLRRRLGAYADGTIDDPPDLPVIACFGTGRLWGRGRTNDRRRPGGPSAADRPVRAARFDVHTNAYDGSLDPSADQSVFRNWFEAASREVQAAGPDNRVEGLLNAVRSATNEVLRPAGWHSLRWDFYRQTIVARQQGGGELPVSSMSDGVRNVIALVADLAHRCARLNPHFGAEAPARTPGIVLIDEVDLHLHPGWQQEIVGALRRAFPRVQFIVSTHSPQVLSTVPRECIRVLEDGPDGIVAREPGQQTEGVPSEDVMAAVMGVSSSPLVPIRADLDRYRALIQDGQHDSPAGQELRARLDKHFELQHPEIVDLDRLIRFQRVLAKRGDG